jgi:hypothetical protein
MPRFAVLLLSALVAVAAGVMAAPVPFPRPGRSGPWFDGWDKQVGKCRFAREGDTLTITVPGAGYELDVVKGPLNAPHLLRDVEGDFIVQVRTGVIKCPGASGAGRTVFRRAALLLVSDNETVKFVSEAFVTGNQSSCLRTIGLLTPTGIGRILRTSPEKPTCLRLERRGDLLFGSFREDGESWERFAVQFGRRKGLDPLQVKLPRKVKIGVLAESTAPGTFKAVFDQFKLTPLACQTR